MSSEQDSLPTEQESSGRIDDDQQRSLSRRGLLAATAGAAIATIPAVGRADPDHETAAGAPHASDVAGEHIRPAYQLAIAPDPDIDEVKKQLRAALDALEAGDTEAGR